MELWRKEAGSRLCNLVKILHIATKTLHSQTSINQLNRGKNVPGRQMDLSILPLIPDPGSMFFPFIWSLVYLQSNSV